MELHGRLMELMVKTKPSIHQNFATKKNGHTVIYVKLQNVLYKCLRGALLCYENMVSKLIGLIVNPYDPCVANTMVSGK